MNATIFIPAVIAIAALAAQPAQAQFFGIGKKKSAGPATSQPCQPSEARKRRNSIFGAIASSIAGSALGSAGAGGTVAGLALPIGSLLSSAIMAKLDCKEQVQAAEATNERGTRRGRHFVDLDERHARQCFGDLDRHRRKQACRRHQLRHRHRCCHRRWRGNHGSKADVPQARR